MEFINTLHRIDTKLFVRIFAKARVPLLAVAAKAISRSADGYLHALIPFALSFVDSTKALQLATLIVVALLLERPLYWLLKNGLKRKRPADSMLDIQSLIVAGDKFSFPSGHTSAAFLLAAASVVVFGGVMYSIFAWAVAVGVSRVVLGVHYPGDTLSGALMGSLMALSANILIGGV
jgi:undecaprenyl-diphosphatase